MFESAPAGADPFNDTDDLFEGAPAVTPESLIEEGPGSRKMPHPITGKKETFVRASQFAGTWSDEYTLTEWKMAMVLLGATHNRDIYARGNATEIPDEPMEFREKGWWKPFNELAHEAIDAAKAKSGAHLGTAVHAWTEQIEGGSRPIKSIPPEWRKHVRAFIEIHERYELSYLPAYREQLIVNLNVHKGVCGRFDALRLDKWNRLIVDDTKTGKNAPMGLDEIAIQLAIYANATHIWAPSHPDSVNGYVPMPEGVRKDVAMISWVPIDDPSKADMIPVDIAEGWTAAQGIAHTLAYRNRAKRVAGSRLGSLRLLTDVLTERPDADLHADEPGF